MINNLAPGRDKTNFCQIPHARLIEMFQFKAAFFGIKVVLTEESYTSQASFLDPDEIPVYDPKRENRPMFGGKRIKRGFYRKEEKLMPGKAAKTIKQ